MGWSAGWSTSGQLESVVDRPSQTPVFEGLVVDLALIRREGITRLRFLDLPALAQAAHAAGDVAADQTVPAPHVEELLRRGVEELGGGRLGECAVLLFGLEGGTRGDPPAQLRREAAERWGVSPARFRRTPQETILSQIAEAVLRRVQRHHERLAHLALERRLPATSRLAVAWLERFQVYYRIWSPITGIAADLCAHRITLLEENRPYDRAPGTDGADDTGYTQERQAEGYATYALWHFTCYLVGVQQFIARYGGMWLLSDAKAEQDLEQTIYKIAWHSPLNERDESYLRGLHEQSNGELHQFRNLLGSETFARTVEQEWQGWVNTCSCSWEVEDEVEIEHFPTRRHHSGINSDCQLHAVVLACNDYCTLIDDDWKRVADWYRLPSPPSAIANDRSLYKQWRESISGASTIEENS